MSEQNRRGESTQRPNSEEPGESTVEMGHRGESTEHPNEHPPPQPHRGEDE